MVTPSLIFNIISSRSPHIPLDSDRPFPSSLITTVHLFPHNHHFFFHYKPQPSLSSSSSILSGGGGLLNETFLHTSSSNGQSEDFLEDEGKIKPQLDDDSKLKKMDSRI
ncbi:hypothetical protein L6452_10311 [Arctium lappa]|uniref:Uncharacterized protein n=1 Tax=Arctium lappa TaxID=4217 RepID=A0ACB9DM13_ARCLA|nr:hypothetical protein L6452_10311 [Arctium lappa]